MDRRNSEILQIKHVLLLLAAAVAAIIFFFIYPSENPSSALKDRWGRDKIIAQTREFLDTQHFTYNDLRTRAQFKVNTPLMDSLAQDYSRSQITDLMKAGKLENLPVYYWDVEWLQPNMSVSSAGNSTTIMEGQTVYTFNLTPDGKIWLFNGTKDNSTRVTEVDRQALAHALSTNDSTLQAINLLLESIPDTVLEHKFIWDINHQIRHFGHLRDATGQPAQLSSLLSRREPLLMDRQVAEKLAVYQLRKELPWFNQSKIDTIYTLPGSDARITRVSIATQHRIEGQRLVANVDLVTSGGLIRLETRFNSQPESTTGFSRSLPTISELITFVVWAFLFIFFVYVFIRRIDARRFDTKNSITDAVLGWFLLVVAILTEQLVSYYPGIGYQFYLSTLISVILVGFIGAIGLFIISGTTESIAREYIPQKMETLSLVRRGYIHNRPVGTVLFRGVCIGLILCGITALLLYVFPHASLTQDNGGNVFLSDQSYLPFIHIIGNSGFAVILINFVIFLGIGSYLYHTKPHPWIFFLVTALLLTFLSVVPFKLGTYEQWIVSFVLGLAAAFIYWRFDLLTSILSSFTSIILWKTSTGWMIPHSPDFVSSIVMWIIVGGLLLFGLWSMYSSSDLKDLPSYIPKYIEEFSQKQRMQHELELARSVQLNFLPREQPHVDGIDIVSQCISAYETGGDYYDFIERQDGSLGFVIADVSGKGIKAAFYMTLLKGYLQCLAHQYDSPAKLLTTVNTLFRNNVDRGIFVSMIYGILYPSTHKLIFARAGHNPLIYRSERDAKSQVLLPEGLAIGMADMDVFEKNINDITLQLCSGDLISVYTDGFTEAMNNSKTLFGDERLVDIIDMNYSYTTQSILDHIVQEIKQFSNGAPQHDDMTMILMKIK